MTEAVVETRRPRAAARDVPYSTRFASLSRPAALSLLVLAVAVIVFGLLLATPAGRAKTFTPGVSDAAFYRAVVERVRKGEPYEAVAVSEQRAKNYPLKPFLTVRPPALAVMLSWSPNLAVAVGLEILLAGAAMVAWAIRLRWVRPGPRQMGWTLFFVFTGVGAAMTGESASLFHEAWAGVLIALSLALRTEKRFVAAVLFGLLAALIRELAMPYLLTMALFAILERRRAEAVAFATALLTAGAALALHAHAVDALVRPTDPGSQGWVEMGGWRFVLSTMQWNGMVVVVGAWAGAVIFPLALIGAGSWKDGTGLRILALLVGYAMGFMVLGRPENFYWGLITAPLVGVGLALAPVALRDLWRGGLVRA